MTTVIARQLYAVLVLTGAGMLVMVAARAAGPQIMIYVTVPLDGPASGHVFGLRLDKGAAAPGIRVINPSSPLNRRAWLDLELGPDSALRLDLDRKLTWDFNRQEWHQSSRPATFTVRLPMREKPSVHDAPATEVVSPGVPEHSALSASLANPLQRQGRRPLVKALAIEP